MACDLLADRIPADEVGAARLPELDVAGDLPVERLLGALLVELADDHASQAPPHVRAQRARGVRPL